MPQFEEKSLGRYTIQRRLGHGGMSDVYLAQDEQQRSVALKVVNIHNTEHHERFINEIEALEALHNKHILPIIEHSEENSWAYMVIPYISSGTLRDYLNRRGSNSGEPNEPLSLEEAGTILTQVASGLQFAHDRGYVHRDIKPSNILLKLAYEPQGSTQGQQIQTYVADFGLAKQAERGLDLTQTGCLVGTPEYMAPELADEMASLSCDIYALGVVLYEMVTGEVPFKGSTPLAIYWKHLRDQPEQPSRRNPEIPRPVEQVIMRALHKDPQRRFRTTLELAQAYQEALLAADEPATRHIEAAVMLAAAQARLADTSPEAVLVAKQPTLLPAFRAGLSSAREAHAFMSIRKKVAVVALAGLIGASALSLGFTIQHPDLLQASNAQSVVTHQKSTPTPTPTPTKKPVTPTPQPRTHITQPAHAAPPAKPNGNGGDDGKGNGNGKGNNGKSNGNGNSGKGGH